MSDYRDILRDQLKVDEGVRAKPYADSVGKLTIGVGRNLTDVGVGTDEIALMLENDIHGAESITRALVPTFDLLSDARKAALVNMAFNLGHRLGGFPVFLAAVRYGRWDDAAAAMLDSDWAPEVGDRAKRLSVAIKNG